MGQRRGNGRRTHLAAVDIVAKQAEAAPGNPADRSVWFGDPSCAQSTASIPLSRYGELEEYGTAVAFLARRQAAYVTGKVQRVDSGLLSNI